MAQDETGLHLSRTKSPDRPMGFLGAGKKDDTRSRMAGDQVDKTWENERSKRSSEASAKRDARARLDTRSVDDRHKINVPAHPKGDLFGLHRQLIAAKINSRRGQFRCQFDEVSPIPAVALCDARLCLDISPPRGDAVARVVEPKLELIVAFPAQAERVEFTSAMVADDVARAASAASNSDDDVAVREGRLSAPPFTDSGP